MAEVIPQLMARRGYARLLSHDDFSAVWLQISGVLGQHSRPGRLRRGILEIVVGNSAVLQELNFQKRPLLKSIQQNLPDYKITDLRFKIGNH